jgi:predicted acylesterase/phospholipase RssA
MSNLQFDRIALSLSGGGFRAAAYGLGTFKTLHLLGLLENVHLLSTASGGTLVGMYYTQRRKADPTTPFADIYQDFYAWLEQDSLLPHALARWKERLSTPSYKLINAFADVYDQELYAKTRFDIFWQDTLPPTPLFHLQSVIFGATELYSGLTFRFQHSAFLSAQQKLKDSYLVGNGNVSISAHHARQLRLGDIVAASSCYPGGFEPLVMPDDFLPAAIEKPILRKGYTGGDLPVSRIALLDGGVYDNQGIESLLLANERNSRHRQNPALSPEQAALLAPSTLYLIADVSGANKGLYQAPLPESTTGSAVTLPRLGSYVGLVLLLFLGLAAGLTWHEATRFWGGLLTGMVLTIVGGLGSLLVVGWRKIDQLLTRVGPAVPGWVRPRLREVSLRQWGYLLKIRLTSTFALLTTVFVRRVRSLNYEALYRRLNEDPPAYQVIPSLIGTIATDCERQKRKKKPPTKPRSVYNQLGAVYPIIQKAQAMPTTLWWQQDLPKLQAIIASAELTLCYQLLRRFEQKPAVAGTQAAEVQRRAQLLWEAYQRGGQRFSVPVTALALLQSPTCMVEDLLSLTNA